MRSLVIILLLWLTVNVNSLITDFGVTSSNTYASQIVGSFGMAAEGKIDITYSVHAQNESTNFNSYFVLIILSEAEKLGWYDGNLQNTKTVCNQPSLLRDRVYGNGNITFTTKVADRYSILAMQCRSALVNNPITASVHVSMRNANPTSSTSYSHLEIQDVMTLRVMEGELIIYSILFVGLVGQFYFMRFVEGL